jgi:hypothetical protein
MPAARPAASAERGGPGADSASPEAPHSTGDPARRSLALLLESRFPGALLPIPHRVFAVVARAPERAA